MQGKVKLTNAQLDALDTIARGHRPPGIQRLSVRVLIRNQLVTLRRHDEPPGPHLCITEAGRRALKEPPHAD
jgi:hypothetical protein